MAKKRLVSVWVPTRIVELIDQLVAQGYFLDRSDAIRAALYYFILHHFQAQREQKSVRVLAGYR